MPYELALELKNAGFPQEGRGVFLKEARLPTGDDPEYLDSLAYVPTLEELIEMCDGKVFMLIINRTLENRWSAAVDGTGASGDTAAEAVARLWLALNRPNKTI